MRPHAIFVVVSCPLIDVKLGYAVYHACICFEHVFSTFSTGPTPAVGIHAWKPVVVQPPIWAPSQILAADET